MPITVYILTTQGPVRVQRITEEQQGIQSVICLDGRAQVLPISSRYDAFVRNPTGVIERATGHGAYRVDVDGMIDEGDSWQLGLYIAHIINSDDTSKDIHIFATGEVDRNLNVRPVGHVSEKIQRAAEVMNDLQNDGSQLHIFIPDHDAEDIVTNNSYPVTRITHAHDVFDRLGLKHPRTVSRDLGQERASSDVSRGFHRPMLYALPLIALIGWLTWSPLTWVALANEGKVLELESAIAEKDLSFLGRYQQRLFFYIHKYGQLERVDPKLTGQVSLAAIDEACNQQNMLRAISWDATISASDAICEMIIKADKPAIGSALVGRMGYWPNGLGRTGKPERTMRGSAGANGHTWKLKFESFPGKESLIRLVILQGASKPIGPQPWYATLLSTPIESSEFSDAKARIERLGYHVTIKDWQRP